MNRTYFFKMDFYIGEAEFKKFILVFHFIKLNSRFKPNNVIKRPVNACDAIAVWILVLSVRAGIIFNR